VAHCCPGDWVDDRTGSFLGAAPLFNFTSSTGFARHDLYWSALLGLIVGPIAMVFVITFRRARSFL
jgi:CIC family chloride channel protein